MKRIDIKHLKDLIHKYEDVDYDDRWTGNDEQDMVELLIDYFKEKEM